MSVVETIQTKKQDLLNEASKLAALLDLAERDWWVDIDSDFAILKSVCHIKADDIIAAAQALKASIPT